jgi:hypothetical protein
MRFDVSGDILAQPNGKQIYYRFKLLNSSATSIIAAEPVIKRGNTVIKCTENPVRCEIKLYS